MAKRLTTPPGNPLRDLKRIPEELRGVDKWVARGRRGEAFKGYPAKQPWNPTRGVCASATDPNTWASFSACYEAVRGREYGGVGFALTGDYVFIDLDGVIDAKGYVLPLALEIIEAVDSYTEVSPSGRGFHIVARNPGMTLARKARAFNLTPYTVERYGGGVKVPGIEMYVEDRYMTMTGRIWEKRGAIKDAPEALEWAYSAFIVEDPNQVQVAAVESPRTPYTKPQEAVSGDVEKVWAAMRRGKHREEIERLARGDFEGYGDNSHPLAKLLDHFAFYTNRNPVLMRSLVEGCDVWRGKFHESRGNVDFLDYEIQRAIDRQIKRGRPTFAEYPLYKATGGR